MTAAGFAAGTVVFIMALFLGLGVLGLILLAVIFVLDDFLDLGDGPLSGPAIAAFLSAFGFGGALALYYNASPGVAVVVGVASGGVLGVVVGVASNAVSNMATDATPNSSNIVGSVGVVVTDIAEGGVGEVNVTIVGTTTKMAARADTALRVGTPIVVDASLSATSVHVTPKKKD